MVSSYYSYHHHQLYHWVLQAQHSDDLIPYRQNRHWLDQTLLSLLKMHSSSHPLKRKCIMQKCRKCGHSETWRRKMKPRLEWHVKRCRRTMVRICRSQTYVCVLQNAIQVQRHKSWVISLVKSKQTIILVVLIHSPATPFLKIIHYSYSFEAKTSIMTANNRNRGNQ